MAEGVFRSLAKSNPRVGTIDSAGTHADIYHHMDPPDSRTMETLNRHGIKDYDHNSRGVKPDDFENFDYIFAMDSSNLRELKRKQQKRGDTKAEVMLFGTFNGKSIPEEVADPYYGADNGFATVYEQVNRFSKLFLKTVVDEEDKK